MVINTQINKTEQRWKPAGVKPALLLNFALDSSRNRARADRAVFLG